MYEGESHDSSAGARLGALVAAVSLGVLAVPATAAPPAPPNAEAESFSIVVLPDTQYNSKDYPQVWDSTGRWIAKNADSRNIKYAIHVGDLVHNSDESTQWQRAVNGMDYLQDAVPYILGVGNHDMDDADTGRDATAFNKNFPVSKFSDLPSFGGSYPEDQNDNSFHTFSAGGTDWLILSLKYDPTDKELDWGNQVVADHPNHQVMVVTHDYQKGTEKDDVGKNVWDELVRKHENVSFVFSGHHTAQGLIEEKGDNGNTVYQVQADYQDSKKLDPNSYFRVMEFHPDKKTVDVETYSPHLGKNLEDEDNQFTLDNMEFMPAP